MKKLTRKQAMFCKEYLVDLNATQAAIRSGYSKKTARRIGGENVHKPDIMAEIQRLMDKRSERVEVTSDDVLKSILDIRANCTQELDIKAKNEDGEVEVVGKQMLDTSGALKANELLGKHLKLFTDKTEVTVKELPEIVIKRGK